VLAGCGASGPDDLLSGVPDPVQQVLRKVALTELRDWDAAIGGGFKQDMDAAGYEKTDPMLLQLVNSHGVNGKEAALLARLLQAVAITERTESRRFAVVGLAVRAGAIDETRVRDAVGSNDVTALDQICREAETAYDGTLDGFVEVYRHYHGYTALTRPKVGINDCLDLEPLLYFDASDPEQMYATGEDLWATVVNLAFEGRAVDVKPIAKARDEDAAV